MSKSIIEAVVFPGSKGEMVHNFGILNAERPFRDSKGKNGESIKLANGLNFGPTNAALLLDRVETDPAGLASELRDYLATYGPQVEPKVEVKPEPKVETPPPAPTPKVESPKPVVATMPAAPTPKPTEPAKPILRATYKGRDYRKLPNGVVQFFQSDRADGKDRWVAYTGKLAIDFSDKPGDRPSAPLPQAPKPAAPTPAPSVKADKPILREIVDEATDTIVILYLDGTYKLVNMAAV